MGHEDAFPRPRLSARCWFSQGTFAGTWGNGRDAPIPDLATLTPERVERWAIDRLIPYAKNARTHSDAQIAAIAASLVRRPRPLISGNLSRACARAPREGKCWRIALNNAPQEAVNRIEEHNRARRSAW
jgi:hypothetical protein